MKNGSIELFEEGYSEETEEPLRTSNDESSWANLPSYMIEVKRKI